jgi:predicted ATPase
MKLNIDQLGPISNSKIEFDKNLYIFTGYNNTGKSYLSYLLYGLFCINKTKYDRILYSWVDFNAELFKLIQSDKFTLISKKNKNTIIVDIEKTFENSYQELVGLLNKELNKLSLKIFSSNIENIKFKVELETLKYKYKNDEIIKVGKTKTKVYIVCKDGSKDYYSFEKNDLNTEQVIPNYFCKRISEILSEDFFTTLCFTKNNIFFLPAERTGLNLVASDVVRNKSLDRDEIAHRVLAGDDLRSLVNRKMKRRILPQYPLALSDYIYFINDIPQIKKEFTKYHELADEIETVLLEGKILIDEYGSLKYYSSKTKKGLDLHVSSSLIKSLSGLVIYLRFVASKNDLIIIDEPELNLHPTKQILFAKIIAKIVNQGFRVILSTHSDYIMREFSNLVILGSNRKKTSKYKALYKYSNEEFLDKNNVSVLLFENNEIISEDISEQGFKVKHIDKIINNHNLISNDIYRNLVEKNDESSY